MAPKRMLNFGLYSIKEYIQMYNTQVNRELDMQSYAIKIISGLTMTGITALYFHGNYMLDQTNKRFEQVDKRFEQVDKRFEKIEDNVAKLNSKVDEILHILKKN